MAAEYLYYLLVFGMGATAAPFNRVALVVFAVWVFGQMAWLLQLPMAASYIGIHMAAFAIGCVVSRNPLCAVVVSLFVPIIAIDVAEGLGWLPAYYGWWGRVYLGAAQLFLLWPAVKFEPLRRLYRQQRQRGSAHVERAMA